MKKETANKLTEKQLLTEFEKYQNLLQVLYKRFDISPAPHQSAGASPSYVSEYTFDYVIRASA